MEPFSAELLTILVIVCISLSGITFIIVISLSLFLICKSCLKNRPQSPAIHPKRNDLSITPISRRSHSIATISSEPTGYLPNTTDKGRIPAYRSNLNDTITVKSEHTDFSYNKNKKSHQKTYTHDKNDMTTAMYEYRTYNQNNRFQSPIPVKPTNDFTPAYRPTPYPPDVLVRDKLMNNSRLPMGNRF